MGTVSRLERFDPSELIAEKDVAARYPGLFREGELAALRKDNKIGHIPLTRQRIFYRPVDIETYLQERFVPPVTKEEEECPANNGSSSTKANGSEQSQEDPDSTDTGSRDETRAAANLLLTS